MKLGRRILLLVVILALLLSDGSVLAATNTLTMPAALQIIDEEAFYGDTSINKVILPNGVTEIHARAFSNSALSEINLPDSLTFIDDSAFDGSGLETVIANEGTYAYQWAVRNGYILAPSVAAKKITVLMDDDEFWVGDSFSGFISGFVSVEPSDFDVDTLTFYSSNTNVATTEVNGDLLTISMVGIGEADIVAEAPNGVTGRYHVVVVDPNPTTKPNKPTNVSAVATGADSINVTWAKPSDSTVTGYKVFYGTSSSSANATQFGSTYGASATSATITGLNASTKYYVWVKATNSAGDSDFSSRTYAKTSAQPSVTVSLNKTSLTLNKGESETLTATITPSNIQPSHSPVWESSDESVVTVEFDGSVTAVGSGTATITYTILYNGSAYSATCSVNVPGNSPMPTDDPVIGIGTPQNVRATANDDGSVTVTWTKTTGGDGYQVLYGLVGSFEKGTCHVDGINSQSCTIPANSLTAGATYVISVAATIGSDPIFDDNYQEGEESESVQVTVAKGEAETGSFIVKKGSTTIIANGSTSGSFACGSGASEGNVATFTVTSDYTWTVRASDTSWMSVQKANSTTAVVTIGAVQDGESYSSTLTFTANGKNYTVLVTLDKPSVSANPTFKVNFPDMTVRIGESPIINATVTVSGGSGYVGKVTVAAYGYSESTMTDDFSGHMQSSISTGGYAAYRIDTSKAPWNTPGTYTVRLWAKDSNGTAPTTGLIDADGAIASMTVKIENRSPGADLPTSLYITQSSSTTCTLASAAMMLRSRAYLSGSSVWSSITESSIKSTAWKSGVGLCFSWTYTSSGNNYSVSHTNDSSMTVSKLKSLLDAHPEGIVLYCYDSNNKHAVFVTDYVGDTFYCGDPASSYSGGRRTLASSLLGARYGSQASILDNVQAYWYISSYSVYN